MQGDSGLVELKFKYLMTKLSILITTPEITSMYKYKILTS